MKKYKNFKIKLLLQTADLPWRGAQLVRGDQKTFITKKDHLEYSSYAPQYKVIKHEHRTMEAFLDDTFGPIEDFFEDDYLRW